MPALVAGIHVLTAEQIKDVVMQKNNRWRAPMRRSAA
jgi:hypothetical protein